MPHLLDHINSGMVPYRDIMVDLFVDIETAPSFTAEEYFELKRRVDSGSLSRDSDDKKLYWKLVRGGLTPFDGKVILITYRINNAHTFRLKEWESGEKEILQKFYNTIGDLLRGSPEDRLRIIGHNILGFDLFFLYNRMLHHGIAEEGWLYQKIINRPEVVDLLQLHLPLNDCQIKGLKHDVLAHAYGFPVKSTLGSGEIPHYFAKEYDRIIEYSEREFIYPELFAKIRSGGLVSRERLQESIRHYNKIHEGDSRKS